jgi:hypothetical protein
LNFKATQECVENSFSDKDWKKKGVTNYLIDKEIEYWKTYGAGMYPAIVINNRTYRGQLEDLAVFNAICAGFKNTPWMCSGTLESIKPDFIDEGIHAWVIIVIVITLIILNVIIVYCYRRYTRREMQG